MPRTVHRQCTLCEAHCGIDVEVDGDRVLRITGDAEDPISRGYICPKAAALADLYTDPDRLRRPVRRVGSEWEEIGWDEALDMAAAGLREVQRRHGNDALATYFGNPSAHTMAALSGLSLRHVLDTRNHYSATSADQLPQHLTSAEMFGNLALFPVPDIDRTDYMLVLGANPSVSNGSLMTAPGARHRLRAIMARGGTVVVVDPRRTETAELASEHVAIAPGGDPYLLLGMLHVLFAEERVKLGHLADHSDGIATIEALASDWPADRAAPIAGVPEATIERLAREFAEAETAVAYGRVGVCQQRTGSLTHWLINLLNAVTGNLDTPGGAMFPNPAFDVAAVLKRARALGYGDHGRHTQRVSGLPEMNGELPVAGLADEITTPGEGQVRGMLIFAGNPVLSTPGGARLEEALATLEWCVAIDMYVTETSRHANVILPPVSTLERSDIDVVMPLVAVRNHIRYSPAAVPKPKDGREDWQILTALTSRLGRGIGRRAEAAMASLPGLFTTPERIIDLGLLLGPHGILRRGPLKGLTVAKVKRAKHGIDLGPLEPRLPGALDTADKRVQLAPPALVGEAAKLAEHAREREAALTNGYDLTLIGRRQLRSNNSWMHNSARLMKGADRCTALLHPDDATARGLAGGDRVRVTSRVGSIELPLEVSDEIRPGVVSIPHGFGHVRQGVGWRLAADRAGASVNDITDPSVVDSLTGNAAFNAVPVKVEAVHHPPDALRPAATAAGGGTA
ncbi:MAG TPA: molybdopterin-dependent oxidoreductase [Thermoleophilaceae bacterium]|nr:molybdopterin-dependent oxidoreductase [Thermoleophilaceae bacterium]